MSRAEAASPWFVGLNPGSRAALRLFCLPYAGGGASIYRNWGRRLPANVEVCGVELPGRGMRMTTPAFTRMEPLVEALAGEILPHLDRPFALFGYSMGALIGFELARRLQTEHGKEPAFIFVSASQAPHIPDTHLPPYGLPDAEFLREIAQMNGTPKEVWESPELVELVLPLLRADFAVCQKYAYRDGPRLNCPLNAYGGLQDETLPRESLGAWREHTAGPFALKMLPGDHFFLNTAQALLLLSISQQLSRHL